MGKQIKVDTEGHRSTVLHRLNGMRETIERCDFTIKVGSEEIFAHSYFLMAGLRFILLDEQLLMRSEYEDIYHARHWKPTLLRASAKLKTNWLKYFIAFY